MKLLFLLLFITCMIFPQGESEKEKYQKSIDSLLSIKSDLELMIKDIDLEISDFKIKMAELEVANRISDGYYLAALHDTKLKSEPHPLGNIILYVNPGDTVLVLEKLKDYYKVSYGNEVGYISNIYLVSPVIYKSFYPNTTQSSNTETYNSQCAAITNQGTQCKRNAQAGSSYCWQHDPAYSPSSSRTIHAGPRGGEYYINSNGKKTYIKKK